MSENITKEEVRTIAKNVLWITNERTEDSLYVQVRYGGELFNIAQSRMADMKDAIKLKTRRWYNTIILENKLYYKNPIWVRVHQSTSTFNGGDAFSTPWQETCCDTYLEPVYSSDIPADAPRLAYNEFMELLKVL